MANPAAPGHPRQAEGSRRYRPLSSPRPDSVPRLGRPRCRRPLQFELRPAGGVRDAWRTHVPRPRTRRADGRHRASDIGGVQPDHRGVSHRRRRLRRRDRAARAAGRRGLGMRPARRLRPDDHHVNCGRGRCHLLLSAAGVALGGTAVRSGGDRRPQRAQHPWRARVGARPHTDLHHFPGDPRDRDRRRNLCPREHGGRHHLGSHHRIPPRPERPRHRRNDPPLSARLLARRRHLHRHRGRVERPADHARAARPHRQAHHALHGRLARHHRVGTAALLPPLARRADAGEDHERGPGRTHGDRAAARWRVPRGDTRVRRGAARGRRASRVYRRPARAVQHGDR